MATTRTRTVPLAATWPGHPTTLDGLRDALSELADAAPVLLASLREWQEGLPQDPRPGYGGSYTPPSRQTLNGRPPSTAGRRRPQVSPEDRRRFEIVARAKQLAGFLVYQLEAAPAMLAQLNHLARAVDGNPRLAHPLYHDPDPGAAVHVVIDLGTSEPTRYSDGFDVVWMPKAVAAAAGIGLWESSPELMDCGESDPHSDPLSRLQHYLHTLCALRDQGEHWRAAWQIASDGRLLSLKRRKVMHASSDRYRGWFKRLLPLQDRLVPVWAASIHQARQALSALADSEGLDAPMSTLTTSGAIAQLAESIRERITLGYGGRIVISGDEVAFGWGVGLPQTLVSLVTTAPVTGRHIDALRVTPTAGDLTPTPEGGTKPNVATFATEPVDLEKFAALVLLPIETAQFVSSVEAALVQVMSGKILRGIEAAIASEMIDKAGHLVDGGSSLSAGVLEAIADVAGAGGQATLLALSPADYVTLMSATGSSGYLSFSRPEDGPGLFLGLVPVIVPSLPAGTSLVADGRAVIAYEAAGAPLAAVDTGSKLSTNEVQVALETWAAGVVASPGCVAKVTTTVTP